MKLDLDKLCISSIERYGENPEVGEFQRTSSVATSHLPLAGTPTDATLIGLESIEVSGKPRMIKGAQGCYACLVPVRIKASVGGAIKTVDTHVNFPTGSPIELEPIAVSASCAILDVFRSEMDGDHWAVLVCGADLIWNPTETPEV